MITTPANQLNRGSGSPAHCWARALESTSIIPRDPERTLFRVIEERAAQFGEAPALLSDRESFTYRCLVERANKYARWALSKGLKQGECVALFMPNRPEFLAIWLGITQVGCTVALLNTHLTGQSLAHCINEVQPRYLISDATLIHLLTTALPLVALPLAVGVHGDSDAPFQRLDCAVDEYAGECLSSLERRLVTIEDRALYIYTSGTTGLPKAAVVTHGRIMQWSRWFAGMMNACRSDRMYDCLPMYHSVGGVQATGAILVGGGAVVIAERFSARQFWSEIIRWDCTLIQYIGELCRYLLHTDPSPQDTGHRITIACGNGLQADVWDAFKNRFRIPRILEFYASTEGNVSLFNVEGEPGSVGRIPSYLAHRFPATLAKFDVETGQPIRDGQGLCIRCAGNEVGELLGGLQGDPSNFGNRFEGYTNEEASERKILRGAFRPGDAWFRTGDLMRRDARGFFYFVDRIGDTFRWKGENVSTTEVAHSLCSFPGIKEANVYGVEVPGTDGRACMAAVVAGRDFNLVALRGHLRNDLPEYARPLFLRLRHDFDMTGTLKYTKAGLAREGFNPNATADVIYFDDRSQESYVLLDQALYDRIRSGSALRAVSPKSKPELAAHCRESIVEWARDGAPADHVASRGAVTPEELRKCTQRP